jgi:hypothetical protein
MIQIPSFLAIDGFRWWLRMNWAAWFFGSFSPRCPSSTLCLLLAFSKSQRTPSMQQALHSFILSVVLA